VKPLFIPVELVGCIVFCIVYHKIVSLGVLLLLSFFLFFFWIKSWFLASFAAFEINIGCYYIKEELGIIIDA
jgi:hypothetical protein